MREGGGKRKRRGITGERVRSDDKAERLRRVKRVVTHCRVSNARSFSHPADGCESESECA